jgi:hypothetical protein
MSTRNVIVLALLVSAICFSGCGTGVEHGEGQGRTLPAMYAEGDTLELSPYPGDIKEWMDFYGQYFPGFNNGQFRSSGVTLHLDSLPKAMSAAPGPLYKSFMAYNPDSSAYIDAWSYGMELVSVPGEDHLRYHGGDADQEVVLGDTRTGQRRQLMYNGPTTYVQEAQWLDRDAFVLTLMRSMDGNAHFQPELYLFSKKDSTFTNFTWTRAIPSDSAQYGSGFFDVWFRKRAKINERK